MKTKTYNPSTLTTTMTVANKSHKLAASWTTDVAEDLQALHGIDIEEIIAKTIQEEIDKEIVFDIMREDAKSMGWHKAELSLHPNIDDKMVWIHLNAAGDYKIIDNHAWFELESDVSHFLLKWS